MSATAVLVAVGSDYHAWGDIAAIELLTRDVPDHPPLLGLYSREDWNHPGPALFYLLAVPYRLLGSSSIAVHVGALLINGAAVVSMGVVARRRGGMPALLLTLVGCALLVHTLGNGFLRSPWNPAIPVLPFGLFLFLVWEMTSGHPWRWPSRRRWGPSACRPMSATDCWSSPCC